MQVLDPVFFEQILSNKTIKVDASLGKSVVLVEGRVSLDGTEVASVVAHVQRLLLISTQRIAAQSVRNSAPCSMVHVAGRRVVVDASWNPALEHRIGVLRRDLAILYFDVVVAVWIGWNSFVVRSRSCTNLGSIGCLSIH